MIRFGIRSSLCTSAWMPEAFVESLAHGAGLVPGAA
jgi:hypothetical protein